MPKKESHIIISPVCLKLSERESAKTYPLNLNTYRNNHYRVNANLKKKYEEIMSPILKDLGKLKTPIKLKFKVFYKNKRRQDRSNTLSIVEKFFCDTLVNIGCIPDDDDRYIKSSFYSTGGIDKEDPRVEINILESS